jgi:DNA-binding MarR family transcriptional regulator
VRPGDSEQVAPTTWNWPDEPGGQPEPMAEAEPATPAGLSDLARLPDPAGLAAKAVPGPGGGQTEHSLWWPMWQLQAAMNADIARIYTDRQISGLKPSYVLELLRLHERGPMTITELAESVHRTHSAMSQKVAAMRVAGLVRTTTGADARSKKVALTPKSRRIIGLLAAEWRATEAALAELESENPYPLRQVAGDLAEALERKSFYDRINEKLAAAPP